MQCVSCLRGVVSCDVCACLCVFASCAWIAAPSPGQWMHRGWLLPPSVQPGCRSEARSSLKVVDLGRSFDVFPVADESGCLNCYMGNKNV